MANQDSQLLHEIHAMVREQRVELSYIKEQTTKTNGRVNKLEEKTDELTNFQTRVITLWSVAIFIITIAINKLI